MSLLARILESKRTELPALRRRALPPPPPARPVRLRRTPGTGLRLIAEFKRRSPSAGVLSSALDVAQRAQAYERAGAAMMSVLCDGPFFGGAYEDLARAREACALPLLCKEFVIDEAQLDAARAHGADAVLLIARCLSPERLEQLCAAARERQLAALVEVHGSAEAQRAAELGAALVGVNARNLDTLEMDLEEAVRALALLPPAATRLHLSGLKQPTDVRRVLASGADGALIGEVLMRRDDPEPLLRELVTAAGAAAAGP